MNFQQGDEVLQVGYISLFEGMKYFLKKAFSIDTIEKRIAISLANIKNLSEVQ